jgi:hypothetical protein
MKGDDEWEGYIVILIRCRIMVILDYVESSPTGTVWGLEGIPMSI